MLLDVFTEDNSLTINFRTIKVFGLPTAVYLTELISIYKKATRKNKLKDGYFKLDRKYIFDLIDLSTQEQLICDSNLMKVNVLQRMPDDPNMLKIDLQMYLSILSNDDFKLIQDIRKQMNATRKKEAADSKRQILKNELKESINTSNYELTGALRDWVDGVFAKPNGTLSKTAIEMFINRLNEYSQGVLAVALDVVKIASINGYRDCSWAIELYEKDMAQKKRIERNRVRTTNQYTSSKEELSDKVF